jgi:hypothetical protein
MATAISLDDLLTAYREAGFASEQGDEGATRAELRAAWGCGEKVVTKYLRMAQDAGVLRVGWRISADISGRPNRIPVYWFAGKSKRKGKVNGP